MKVEIWSDYVCPFCYIGKRNFEQALKQSGLAEQVEVEYKAYQLSPDAPATSPNSYAVDLANKYGVSEEEAQGMLANMQVQAKQAGLDYAIDKFRTANTFMAHRLAKYASEMNLGGELAEALLHAYFIEAQEIGRPEVLTEIAVQVGLNQEAVVEVLQSSKYDLDVRRDIQRAQQIGVQGVPFFVINNKYGISGAQPAEVFAQTLEKVAEEEGITPKIEVLGDSKGVCTDDNCNL